MVLNSICGRRGFFASPRGHSFARTLPPATVTMDRQRRSRQNSITRESHWSWVAGQRGLTSACSIQSLMVADRCRLGAKSYSRINSLIAYVRLLKKYW